MQRYVRPLLERIARGEIDPSFVITHRGSLDDAPGYYRRMAHHDDGFVKSFLRPGVTVSPSVEYADAASV
jgi:threonine dehydrogenase-like Zn-dependent dehydrogenase